MSERCAVKKPDLNGALFDCPNIPGKLRLSPASCAANYRSGKVAAAWQTTRFCKGCQIGAGHAGEVVQQVVIRKVSLCRSCGAAGGRIVHGLLCVSCYNRLTEALRGRNARGKVPTKWRVSTLPGVTMVRCSGLQFAGAGKLEYIARAPVTAQGDTLSLLEACDAAG